MNYTAESIFYLVGSLLVGYLLVLALKLWWERGRR